MWITRAVEEELAALLADGGPRLVTVFGLGGAGASSVVARVLRKSELRIDLGDVTRAADVGRRLRAIVAPSVWLDQVHRPELVRDAVLALLARGATRVVVAGRAPLDAPDEHRLPVGFLEPRDTAALLVAEIRRHGARPPPHLHEVVPLLDGWPLAIRAAALEARVFGCNAQAIASLHERAPALREVLERAWGALGGEDRALLGALSMASAAPFARDAAVLVTDGHAALARLVDRSLVVPEGDNVAVPRPVAAFVRAQPPTRRGKEARSLGARAILAAGERAKAMHRRDPASACAELARLQVDLVRLTHEPDARVSVAAALILEPLLVGRLERDVVLALWHRMTQVARRLPSETRAEVALALARTLISRGEHESAERVLKETAELSDRPSTSAYRALYLGHIAAWRGALDDGRALLDEAVARVKRPRGQREREVAGWIEEDALLQRTFVAYQEGDLDRTDVLARECATLALRGPSPRLGAVARRFAAEVMIRRGDPAGAAPLLERTRDELFRFGDQAGALYLWSRLVEALRAAGDPRAMDEARAASVIAARSGEGPLELSVLDALDRTETSAPRVAELAWRAQIPVLRSRAASWLASERAPADGASLHLDTQTCRAFVDGKSVSFARRQTLWRMLRALVDAHARTIALSSGALFVAGWPGDRAEPASQRKRVQTAVWTLRRLLLGKLLETRPEGYALFPSLRIARGET